MRLWHEVTLATVMLVTTWHRQVDVGDDFLMLMTEVSMFVESLNDEPKGYLKIVDVGDQCDQNRHHHLIVVTNTLRQGHSSPTST